uniref:Uncharacterized protein n=1 Tax=Tanacetum cinerariifolium TaxID=118510 RepID=A0A6L2N1L3_TANCI|nr:hypothetical protein [Tanacetum cinerariifolium]
MSNTAYWTLPNMTYQVKGYDEGIVYSYEQRLETIWGRAVNRVHMLDFAGLTDGMRQTLSDRLSMIYTGDDRHALFTSYTWRRLFEVRGLLVREFTLEFFSTCRMSDTEMGLDVADTLCFQLGGARRRMICIQFILALGLHTEEEMAEAGFGAYWFGRPVPSYVFIRDSVRRLCHGMIAYSISGKGQAPEKVTAQYLFRHAERRKSRSSELLLIDLHELVRLNIYLRVGDTWAWVAPGPVRQQATAAGTPGAAEDAPAADEGAQAVLAPV